MKVKDRVMNYAGVKKNPADNKKTDSSSTATVHCSSYTGSENSSGARVNRRNSFINEQYSVLILVL